jgi:hypothetical protein
VPPIEGFDFSPWIEEMGADALPFGLNVFPIEQLGIEVDRMLSINEDNCERFREEFTVPFAQIEAQNTLLFTRAYPDLAEEVVSAGGTLSNFCEYLDWAYYTGVSLKGEWDYDMIRNQPCMYNSLQRVSMMNKVDLTDKNLVTGTMINEIINKMTLIMDQEPVTDPTQEANTVFFNYQVLSNDILNAMGRSLFNQDDFAENYGGFKAVLPPSSQIVIEVRNDTNDDGTKTYSVYASLNDICMNVYNCGENVYDCQIPNWITQLTTEVGYTDMETTCADMTNL